MTRRSSDNRLCDPGQRDQESGGVAESQKDHGGVNIEVLVLLFVIGHGFNPGVQCESEASRNAAAVT